MNVPATSLRYLLLAALALLLLSGVSAIAQTVTGTRNISFGQLGRSTTVTVAHSSSSSATFTIVGKQKKPMRITITAANLSKSSSSLPITLSNSQCAYSLDAGATWTTFTTGTLYQDVTIQNGTANGGDGEVYIRVGGSVTSSSTQARGTYNGSITVTATYL